MSTRAANPDTMSAADWDRLSDSELDALERKIAGQYMHIIPWGVVLWALGNTLIWLSLWPLVLLDIIPLWLLRPSPHSM